MERESNPALLVRLLKRRPEFTDPDGVDASERASFRQVMAHYERSLQEKATMLN